MYGRSFGVEIECKTPVTGTDHYGHETRLGAMGTRNLLKENGYPDWADRICYDGSEIEIRSPILYGHDGMRQLKSVMNLLKDKGFSTTECDGMHCHFGAEDLNESDILRVIKSWDNNADIVHKFLGERFYNCHCTYDYEWSRLEQGTDNWGHTIWDYDGEKCFAIEPRQRMKTLEFRQHYGTLNFDDARAWILFVQAFIKNVKERKGVIKKSSMEELFKMTRTYKVAQKNLVSRKELSYNYDGDLVWN